MFFYLLSVLFAYYILKPVSRSMFLTRFDVDKLPWLYILIAAFGGVFAYLYSKLAAKTSLRVAVTWTMSLSVGCLVGMWALIHLPFMVYVLNIFVSLFSIVLVSQGWLVASNLFDPREAKRVYPLLGMGMVIGAELNAALAELSKLGIAGMPIIGLAKEFEEIYRPGENEPLRLDHNTGALKLLQRVRDESHRFANTYNAKLRLKKISESILDEFPGIGERRKAALLKKFGSIQRLRTATLEQIAEVPGFGGKAANELKAFLDARPAGSLSGS